MTPREFFNAWIGWSDARNENLEYVRDIIYGASKYNAANTAFSSKQSEAIIRKKFPWEKGGGKKNTEPMSAKQVSNILDFISKPEKQN